MNAKKHTEAEKNKTILVMAVGFMALYLLSKKPAMLYIGFGIGFLALLSGALKTWILFLWDKMAQALGWINTRILLTVVFYVFLLPIALISRMFGKNLLQLKRQTGSVYAIRDHAYTKEDLENTW